MLYVVGILWGFTAIQCYAMKTQWTLLPQTLLCCCANFILILSSSPQFPLFLPSSTSSGDSRLSDLTNSSTSARWPPSDAEIPTLMRKPIAKGVQTHVHMHARRAPRPRDFPPAVHVELCLTGWYHGRRGCITQHPAPYCCLSVEGKDGSTGITDV